MNFTCQQEAIHNLKSLACSNKHSILIEGPQGCGKTYLASEYARMLNVPDFQSISPTVQAIRECLEECAKLESPVVICIENLDTGVPAASYTLLKFLEEPTSNVYIVITCRNMNHVPDTIISRSVCVVASPPINSDIEAYATSKNFPRYHELEGSLLWRCVRTFQDVDTVLNMSVSQFDYFDVLNTTSKFVDSVSNIVWALSHYPDNTETPIELVLRYVSEVCNTQHIRKAAIDCIYDLSQSRIAPHAALAKFAFEAKYCE